MHASYILRADLLDIIFENRNKAYGAYALRKFYDSHVLKSLGIVILLLSAFSYIAINAKHPDLLTVKNIPDHKTGTVILEAPPAMPNQKPRPRSSEKNMSNKIVMVDSTEKTDSLPRHHDLSAIDGPAEIISGPVFSGSGGGTGDAPPVLDPLPIPVLPAVDRDKPMDKADIDPAYPGGLKALTKFLERNLQNPAEIQEGETVSVKVKFVVGFDGELKAFEVKQDGGELFNQEVIRVLKKMPRWIPGKTNGQHVSVYFTIPVKFINGQ